MLTAGTDVKQVVVSTAAVLLGVAAVFGSAALYVWRQDIGSSPRLRNSARQRFDDLITKGSLARQRAGAVPEPPAPRSPV